jgi:hypothetical protein
MNMTPLDIRNYGQALQLVDKCYNEYIQIYSESLDRKHRLPIDNWRLWVMFAAYDPDEYFPMIFWELEDGSYLLN